LIQQAAQPLHRRLFGPGEAALLGKQPVDLSLGDHPGAEALEEQLASGHRFVTKLLHPGGSARLLWGYGPLAAAQRGCGDWLWAAFPGASRSLTSLAMISESRFSDVHLHLDRVVWGLHGRLFRPLVRDRGPSLA